MTLLETLWGNEGDEDSTLEGLESGEIKLSGNFRGREAEIVEQCRELDSEIDAAIDGLLGDR